MQNLLGHRSSTVSPALSRAYGSTGRVARTTLPVGAPPPRRLVSPAPVGAVRVDSFGFAVSSGSPDRAASGTGPILKAMFGAVVNGGNRVRFCDGHGRGVRRAGRAPAGAVVLSGLLALALSACAPMNSIRSTSASPSPSSGLASAPPSQPAPSLTDAQVSAAVSQLDGVVRDAMTRTGVPGVAVAVVHQDKVVYAKGFGVREVGKPDTVDPNTVFQLASVSKPLSSTVIAAVVGQKTVAWDDPIQKYDPGFALADPWVSRHVTVADMFSHRSGLPDHAGDLLEDLGYQRDYILQHLRDEPLAPFRAGYAYTNFGLTEAAVAVAKAKGMAWEDLAADMLYKPLGMNSTSYRRADYDAESDKAVPHVEVDGKWQPGVTQDADLQSPAGGVSSTVNDMTRWMRLQLGNGTFEGKQLVDAASLDQTRVPHSVAMPPSGPAGQVGFYGLGWNVNYDTHGRLRLNHSGGFDLGAATTVTLLPSEQLGIVVLTNGQPVGVPEAVAADFFDLAQDGKESVDWLGFFGRAFAAMATSAASPTDYAKPPSNATPAKPDSAYTGTYANGHHGPLTVTTGTGGGLVMSLGPDHLQFPLQHYTADTFSYRTRGESAVGLSGVTFSVGASGPASKVVLENLNTNGLGTFTRS